MHFKDKVVWITGASSGIGAALAKILLSQGARVILTARNEAAMQALAVEFSGNEITILPADLTDATSISQITQQAIAAFGKIDVLMLNAGVSQRSAAEETDPSVYRALMEINFFAPVAITTLLLPYFRKWGGGHIVAISSMAGLMGFPLRTGYAASKHALKGFFETLQTEHTIPALHITLVYPGRIQTPISLSALTAKGKAHGQWDQGQLEGIPVEKCVAKILSAVQRNKRRVIIARGEKLLWWLWFWVPALYFRIARKKGLEG